MVVAPGVYDGLTARIAIAQSFECLYMVCKSRDFARSCVLGKWKKLNISVKLNTANLTFSYHICQTGGSRVEGDVGSAF